MPTPISYFDYRYHALYQAHLAIRTKAEVDLITSYTEAGSTILDAACGYGRHAIELARQGYLVTGVDASPDMIALAKQSATEQQVSLALIHSTIETFTHAPFDASLLLFSSFGYSTEADDQNLFNAIGRLTKKGGLFIVDGRNRLATSHINVHHKKTNGPETHWLDGKEWIMQHVSKDAKKTQTSILLYTAEELQHMLAEAKFTVRTIFSDFTKTPFTPDSERFLVIAQKN